MKILHIEDRIHPDMGYQVNFFAKFHNPQHEFVILTSDSFSLWGTKNIGEIINHADQVFEEKNQVKIIRNKAKLDRKGKNNLWLCKLTNTIEKIKPDVIFTHGIENFTTFRILLNPKIRKKYFIVSDTHTLYNQFHNNFKLQLFNFFIKTFIATKVNNYKIPVFYTAPENKNILKEIYGIADENIHPCLIGTDFMQYYFSENSREEIRNLYYIEPDEILLLYVGKINQLKQPHLVLEAIKLIENNIDRKLTIFFIGAREKDYFEKHFPAHFKNGLIKTQVLNPVKSQELYKYYSAADLAVFPKENTLSALDAQACKLPLVMEEDETNLERLQKGGLLYKKDDIPNLADKILKLIIDSDLRMKLSIDGYDYVSSKFNYAEIVRNMEEVIERYCFNVRKNH